MNKIRFAIVKIGNIQHLSNLRKIKSWRSKLFEVNSLYSLENLPQCNFEDGYLDMKYCKEEMVDMISCPDDCDLAVGIMPYRFVDNFYMHRVTNKTAVISLYGIKDILDENNISVDHFILKQLYELCVIKHILPDISDDSIYDIIHFDTRGCLFDMNGDRKDILYNTESPVLCSACRAKLKSRQLQLDVIKTLDRELKKLRKPVAMRVELWIKRYPFVSLLLSALVTILLSVAANFISEWCMNI